MSEICGNILSHGLEAVYNDLETDAEPELPPPYGHSGGLVQTVRPSTACLHEISSGGIPMEQEEEENSTGAEAKFSDAHQSEQMQRPDGPSSTYDQIFLPPALKQQQFDILIIYSEEDKPAAEDLKKTIEKLYAERIDGEKTPFTVGLMEEVALHVRSNIDWLDVALSCCTYTFVIFTQHLKNDPVLSEMTKASLWATFSEEKKNKFCPVYLERGAKEVLQLSVYFNQLSSVNLWKDPCKAQIEKYIDIGPRIERCQQQDREIKEYCKQMKDTTARSTSAEIRCHRYEFHENQVSLTAELRQTPIPLLNSAMDCAFSKETTSMQNKEVATDNSNGHSSDADSTLCHLKLESDDAELLPDDMSTNQDTTKGESYKGVKNSPQTSTDWHRYSLPMTAGVVTAVVGAGLVFLFRK